MKTPKFKHRQIGSLESLSKCLGISLKLLENTSIETEKYYISNEPILKQNGGIRQTYSVLEPLKTIQNKILNEILEEVDYPGYLQGAIKDPDFRRDYIRDAQLHSSGTIIMKFDIKNCFPSSKANIILRIWKYFFRFPPKVANILTSLTTYKGFLPQGASTSSALANLLFWDREPELEYEFRENGYVYSRYIDDITISTTNFLSDEDKRKIKEEIYEMISCCGLRPKRNKKAVLTMKSPMSVHNLNLNSGIATIPSKTRNNIRAAVKNLEEKANNIESWKDIEKDFESVAGRVNFYSQLHPHSAYSYKLRLIKIKEKYSKNMNNQPA